jgi:hypothetical protein
MIETIKMISNPLTVIAIFAGLAEVSGTAVLPFIGEANQVTYVWFLIIFPAYLVGLFFLTLNFNPRVLYAPSDFRDEENYMKIFRPSSTSERLAKINEEFQESGSNIVFHSGSIVTTGDSSPVVKPEVKSTSQRKLFEQMVGDPRSLYILAENLIIDRLSAEFRVPVKREVVLNRRSGRYLYDAIIEDKRGPIIVEIKFLARESYARRVREILDLMQQAIAALPDDFRARARLLLAFAHELEPETADRMKQKVEGMFSDFIVPVEVRMYALDALITEAGTK